MTRALPILAVVLALPWSSARAEMNGTTRISVMNDMSSVYADFQGQGSVIAAQLAVEDFAKQSNRKVEVLAADHQNKPDIGAASAGRWFDTEGVDMIIDLPNSAVALAVADRDTTDTTVPSIVLSTAHPAKFPDAVEAACGQRPQLPAWLDGLMTKSEHMKVMKNDQAEVERFVLSVSRAAKQGVAG